jgi:hypothetical protein
MAQITREKAEKLTAAHRSHCCGAKMRLDTYRSGGVWLAYARCNKSLAIRILTLDMSEHESVFLGELTHAS